MMLSCPEIDMSLACWDFIPSMRLLPSAVITSPKTLALTCR